eukprot:gene12201-13457_t
MEVDSESCLAIVKYWQEHEKKKKHFDKNESERFREHLRRIKIKFFVHIQIEEDIGTKSSKETERIIGECDEGLSSAEIIEDMFIDSGYMDAGTSKSKKETLNLYEAYKHLQGLLNEAMDDGNCLQLLDIEECLKHSHEILMSNILDSENCGKFSTEVRYGTFNGRRYMYPKFASEEIVHTALQAVIDQYNRDIDHLKKKVRRELATEDVYQVFKLASQLLFSFLQLHPFKDGNGRLSRLLCSYCLNIICPFPSPIYNVFAETERSHFIDAIVKARTKSDGKDILDCYFDDESQLDEDIVLNCTIDNEPEAKKLALDLWNCDTTELLLTRRELRSLFLIKMGKAIIVVVFLAAFIFCHVKSLEDSLKVSEIKRFANVLQETKYGTLEEAFYVVKGLKALGKEVPSAEDICSYASSKAGNNLKGVFQLSEIAKALNCKVT